MKKHREKDFAQGPFLANDLYSGTEAASEKVPSSRPRGDVMAWNRECFKVGVVLTWELVP